MFCHGVVVRPAARDSFRIWRNARIAAILPADSWAWLHRGAFVPTPPSGVDTVTATIELSAKHKPKKHAPSTPKHTKPGKTRHP